MNCRHCSKILRPDWYFCPNCGKAAQPRMNSALPFLTGDRELMFDEIARQAVSISPFQSAFRSGSYGNNVRAAVFEVIVRQALAGAPWREICASPMEVNNISPDEVQAEVDRRGGPSQG